ncbi:MAG: DUF6173 family protein [Gemmobacter sp.]
MTTGREDIATTAEAMEASILRPSAGVVHADPEAPVTVEQEPLPEAITREPINAKSPARWAYERLILYIRNFETKLEAGQEVAIGFAGSDAGVLRIEGLGYFDPDIVTFYGTDEDGTRTQLIQHVSQLNVMLQAIRTGTAETPPRRIGFRLAERLEQGD